jgi:hypothetical protein
MRNEEQWTRHERELRARLAEIVLDALLVPHDGRYRTEHVAKTVEQIWLATQAYRRAVLDEAALGRMMAL